MRISSFPFFKVFVVNEFDGIKIAQVTAQDKDEGYELKS